MASDEQFPNPPVVPASGVVVTQRHAETGTVPHRRFGAVFVAYGDQRVRLEPGKGSRGIVGGRGKGCDILIDHASVSAAHFEIVLEDHAVVLRDLGSSNGTFLPDGVRVREVVIFPGHQFRAGAVTVRLEGVDELEVPASIHQRYGELIGNSSAMREAFALLGRIADSKLDVIVGGESGTGKELVGRAIHMHSSRAAGPYVVLDCASLAGDLAASVIFGHVRGAFTGATSDRVGCFEEAHGGTLFIDEIGDLPLELQPKLLRLLESRQVIRMGENRRRDVDVRVIAASHRNLRHMVANGTFREDIYHRLEGWYLELPALRDRSGDIELLARCFLRDACEGGDDQADFTPAAIAKLREHTWPGNVRELRNAIRRAAELRNGRLVDRSDLILGGSRMVLNPDGLRAPEPPPEYREYREYRDRRYLNEVLAYTKNNVKEAARIAGVTRETFYKLLRQYGVDPRKIDVDADGGSNE